MNLKYVYDVTSSRSSAYYTNILAKAKVCVIRAIQITEIVIPEINNISDAVTTTTRKKQT